jgi:hypothetical protein
MRFFSYFTVTINFFCGFNFETKAKPSTKIVKLRKYGRKGSSQEKVEATPLVPLLELKQV